MSAHRTSGSDSLTQDITKDFTREVTSNVASVVTSLTCGIWDEHDCHEEAQQTGPAHHPELGGIADVVEEYSGY